MGEAKRRKELDDSWGKNKESVHGFVVFKNIVFGYLFEQDVAFVPTILFGTPEDVNLDFYAQVATMIKDFDENLYTVIADHTLATINNIYYVGEETPTHKEIRLNAFKACDEWLDKCNRKSWEIDFTQSLNLRDEDYFGDSAVFAYISNPAFKDKLVKIHNNHYGMLNCSFENQRFKIKDSEIVNLFL